MDVESVTKKQTLESPSTIAEPAATASGPTVPWVGPSRSEHSSGIPGYEILGELGRGGMGVVYKARQTAVHRIVALKMLLGADDASPDYLARFHAEAEAAARLQHPQIVQLYEFGEADGRPYFSLEFIDGGSLADRLRGVPQPFESTADLIAQLAEAMHYAHQHGVVHRDLKPANILLATVGGAETRSEADCALGIPPSVIPKIADFGLAKQLDAVHAQTTTGAVLGTPSYMSPEQAAGHTSSVGPAADIYALGAILYECLIGRPPFRGATALETVLQVARDEPVAPRLLRPDTPRDLETICLKCLAKEPAKRYVSAQALADDLHRFLKHEPIAARPASTWERLRMWSRRHPARAVLYASIAVGATIIVGFGIRTNAVLRHAYKEVVSEQRQAQGQLVRRIVADGAKALDDGDYLSALPWFAEALRLEEDPERVPIHRMRWAATLRLCPTLLEVLSRTASVADVAVRPGGDSLAILFDDGALVVTRESSDHRAELSGIRLRSRVRLQPNNRSRTRESSERRLHFDPAGRWLAVDSQPAAILDLQADSGAPRQLELDQTVLAWVGNGRLLTVNRNTVTAWRIDSKVMRGPMADCGSPALCAACNASGSMIATGHRNGEVRLWNSETLQPMRTVAKLPGSVVRVQFSPNGERLLAAGGAIAQVWGLDTDKPATPPLHHAQTITDATFSPDGATIATASIDDTARLWNAGDGRPLVDPLKHNSDVYRVEFSGDGRLLATCGDDNTARVWDVRLGTAHSPPMYHAGTVESAVFAGGGRIVTAGDDGNVKLWRVRRLSDDPIAEPAVPTLPQRLAIPGGRFELAAGDDGQTYRVFDGQEQRWLPTRIVHPGGVLAIDVSADGRFVATAGNDRTARIWDWRTGHEATPPLTHTSRVGLVAFSPDSRLVATASDDNSARVWSLATAQPLTPFLWQNGTIRRIVISPDSRFLLTAGKGALATIWDIASGEELAPVDKRERWLAGVLTQRDPAQWDLPSDDRSAGDLLRLAEWLSGYRADAAGGLAPLPAEEFERLARAVRPLIAANGNGP